MLKSKEITLERGVPAVKLENDKVEITILPDKGADIYQWIHKGTGVDVLWKSPWGLRKPGAGIPSAFQSTVTWIEWYPGGWQVLFPSGGGPCNYRGVELNFHGEASSTFWDVADLGSNEDEAWVRLTIRLARSPFTLTRDMVLERDASSFLLRETVRNDGGEPMDYVWGHHPAYGAPFLSQDCRIDTNARTLLGDDTYDPPACPWELGKSDEWPVTDRDGVRTDLSAVPGTDDVRGSMGYLGDFDAVAWYGITNTRLGIGAGLAWRTEDFPHAWFWQEMHASPGFPWYKGVYVMAIEPSTTNVGQGLVAAMEKNQSHRTLQPGESRSAEIRAVLYDSTTGISSIDMEGNVRA
jgi:galactose mutarotase-like enzyme